MARRGLTLVELLVVMSVICLLAAISFPALLRVRNQAQGAVCVQNVRTLSLAWLCYKDDNDDRLVGGQAGKFSHAWVSEPRGAGTIVERHKEALRQGALYQYVGDENAYRCPADRRVTTLGQLVFCSYSVAGGANGEVWQNTYVPAVKYSEIVKPAARYVFVEEADPRGWNPGSWLLNPANKTWVDPLAIWHSDARSTLGYADGRAETRGWADKSTVEMSHDQVFGHPVPPDEGEDLRFMLGGFPQKAESSAGRTP